MDGAGANRGRRVGFVREMGMSNTMPGSASSSLAATASAPPPSSSSSSSSALSATQSAPAAASGSLGAAARTARPARPSPLSMGGSTASEPEKNLLLHSSVGTRPPRPVIPPRELFVALGDPATAGPDVALTILQLNAHFLACSNMYEAREVAKLATGTEAITGLMDHIVRGERFAHILHLRLLENLAVEPFVLATMVKMEVVPIILGILRTPEEEVVLASLLVLDQLKSDPRALMQMSSESSLTLIIDLLSRGAEYWRPCILILAAASKSRAVRTYLLANQGKLRSRLNEIIRNGETPDAVKALTHHFWRKLSAWIRIDHFVARQGNRGGIAGAGGMGMIMTANSQQNMNTHLAAPQTVGGRRGSISAAAGPGQMMMMPPSPLHQPKPSPIMAPASNLPTIDEEEELAASKISRRHRSATVVVHLPPAAKDPNRR